MANLDNGFNFLLQRKRRVFVCGVDFEKYGGFWIVVLISRCEASQLKPNLFHVNQRQQQLLMVSGVCLGACSLLVAWTMGVAMGMVVLGIGLGCLVGLLLLNRFGSPRAYYWFRIFVMIVAGVDMIEEIHLWHSGQRHWFTCFGLVPFLMFNLFWMFRGEKRKATKR